MRGEGCRPWGGLTSYPPDYRAALACSLILPPLSRGLPSRVAVPCLSERRGREDNGVATFRRCTGVGRAVSLRRRRGVCAGGVRSPRTGPRAVLAQAYQQLTLVLCDDASDTSPGLALTTRSWFPTALLLAVAGPARAGARPPDGGGYVLPGASCGTVTSAARPGRILLAEQQVLSIGPPTAAQLHRRPRVAPERPNSAAGP